MRRIFHDLNMFPFTPCDSKLLVSYQPCFKFVNFKFCLRPCNQCLISADKQRYILNLTRSASAEELRLYNCNKSAALPCAQIGLHCRSNAPYGYLDPSPPPFPVIKILGQHLRQQSFLPPSYLKRCRSAKRQL